MQVSELFTADWMAVWVPIALIIGAWAFKVERNTSKTATSNEFIKSALESLTTENKQEHEKLHGRINEVDARVDVHAIEITRLQGNNKGGLCSDG